MIYFKCHLCIFFQNREPLHPPWRYVLLVKKSDSFFGSKKITLHNLELMWAWRILQTLCFKKSQEIRLFITIIYCSDLLCFLIVQFTKKIPLLPFVFISRLWKISHINLQKSFPSDIVINQRGEYRKWIQNVSNSTIFNHTEKTACLTTISEKMTKVFTLCLFR